MKQWTEELSQKLRYKRSDLKLNRGELCKILEISSHTLKNLEEGSCKINQSNYIKLLEWLVD